MSNPLCYNGGMIINILKTESSLNQASSTAAAEKPGLIRQPRSSPPVLASTKPSNELLTNQAGPSMTKPKPPDKPMPPKTTEKALPAENRVAEKEKANADRQRPPHAAIPSTTRADGEGSIM